MFNRLDLARVASASTGSQANWLYRTDDDLPTVLDPNYFGLSAPQFRVNDVIQCKLIDRYVNLSVLIVDSPNNQVTTQQIDFVTPLDQQGLVNWRGNWVPDVYEKNDQVLDNGWLMIANKTTVDRPSPQSTGSPEYSLPEIPVWTEETNESVVYSGQKWTFTKGGWINLIRVWVPELTVNTSYRFIIILTVPGQIPITTIIEEPVLNENGWTTLALGSQIVAPGTSYTLVIDALNSGASTNISGGWQYQGPSQGTAPPSQNWTQDNQRTNFRIDKTDLDSQDRSAELEGVIAESLISAVQTNDVGRSSTYRVSTVVDSGTYMTYGTTLLTETGGGVADGAVTTIDIDVPIPLPTKYEELLGNWPAQNPTWATVEGYLAYDELDNIQAGSELNAYGTDILFNEGTVSEDWDVAASSEGGGSSSFSPVEVLGAFSLVEQNPVTTDAPVNINFGIAQGTPSDVIELDADGLITFNKGAVFSIRMVFSVSRTSNPQTAFLFLRAKINGVAFGNPISAALSENLHSVPLEFTFTAFFSKGTTVQLEMYRDSAGIDNGGLAARLSSIGWGTSPSASIRITELT